MSIGNTLSYVRKMNGYSQQQLAEISGVHRSTIANIESDRQKTNVATLIAISKGLKISVGVLVGEIPLNVPSLKITHSLFCDDCGVVQESISLDQILKVKHKHASQHMNGEIDD